MANMFLNLQGFEGESEDANHQNWIEIHSFSHGVSMASGGARSTGGAATGHDRADHQDVVISKVMDATSPKLAVACALGKHFDKATIDFCRSVGDGKAAVKYMEYKLTDVVISSCSIGAGGGGDLPQESVTLNYGKIEWTYTKMDHATGKSKGQVPTWASASKNEGGGI